MQLRDQRSQSIVLVLLLVFFGSVSTNVASDERITDALAKEIVEELRPRVASLRGLDFVEPVPVSVVDDAAVREHMLGRLERFDQLDRMRTLQHVYANLGLISREEEILDALMAAIEEQVGGFYDPGTRSYYLLDDMPAATASIFTVHELTHALEDQHFDLDGRLRAAIEDDDRLFALSAIHEGSATALMTVYSAQAMLSGELDAEALVAASASDSERMEAMTALPSVLVRQLLAPYVLGSTFLVRGNMMALAAGYPRDAVDRVYETPPTSSEQILHPEKYWDEGGPEPPVALAPSDDAGGALGKGWKRTSTGVLGELTLGLLVGAPTPGPANPMQLLQPGGWTNEAATGWGGDRWELWERNGEQAVLLDTVWDTESDAAEFVEALGKHGTLRRRQEGRQVAIVAGDVGRRAKNVLRRMVSTR